MVDYQYHSLFYKSHQTKDIIIVDSGATVTAVSGEAPTISGATIEIHTEDIESESFTLDESICSEDNLKFGLCESAGVHFTIKNKAEIPNLKKFDDLKFYNVYIYFNGDSDTLFQVGQYICDKDTYVSNRKKREIDLYDVLYKLNEQDITSWYNSYFASATSLQKQIIYVIADLFNWISKSGSYANDDTSPNIPIALDSNYTLTNGTFQIEKTIESDTVTFGFFMQGLLEFNGCFGHINREGKFQILMMAGLDSDFVRTVTDDFRIPPTSYDDDNTWGIGQIDVYDRTNVKKFTVQNTNKKEPNIYVMVDPWILADREPGDSTVKNALDRMLAVINHYNYNPSETECSGDLCVEVGDRIKVSFTAEPEDTRSWYRTYVLERHFTGIQSMRDTYTARGDKKQPKYVVVNDMWHNGDSQSATSGNGTGGVAELNDEHDKRYVELQRNYGLRVLGEPSVNLVYNKSDQQVEIKWTDPSDLTDYKPVPCEWNSTVVVRKEGSAPLNIWDGTILVTSTTRDEYSSNAFVDNTIEVNKKYYYGIFPCHVALDDADHPIKHYRFTKVYSVDTTRFLVAPTIFPITVIGMEKVTISYAIPVLSSGSYAVRKLVVKKDSIPTSKTDGDIILDLTPEQTLVNTVEVTGLDYESHYYFVIFIEDTNGIGASSEPQDCVTLPNPVPSEYQAYVNKLALTSWGATNQNSLLVYFNSKGNSNSWELSNIYTYCTTSDFNTDADCYYLHILSDCTINITTNDDSVSVSYDLTMAGYNVIQTWGRSTWGTYSESGNLVYYIETWVDGRTRATFSGTTNVDTCDISFTTSFDSMASCLSYLTQHFRRCNLVVDGVTWLDVD